MNFLEIDLYEICNVQLLTFSVAFNVCFCLCLPHQEISLTERLCPRAKPPNVKFTIKIDREKEDESKIEKSSPPQFFRPQRQALKAEPEVEIFTSTSLAHLVKIMHPYCLRLHVEEEVDKLRRNHNFFSREEVWKYERPSEEIDEEINVVSDDEETMEGTKEVQEGDDESGNGKLLKSVLLSGKSPRGAFKEKKRVSFGPVQVASFDVSVETGLNEKKQTGGHTSRTVSVPLNSKTLLTSPDSTLEVSPETKSNQTEALPPKGDIKAKTLSLQQYRQLCQKRLPLMEAQGNYTTKWPSIPEPPKGLTPIFCLQGQTQNNGEPEIAPMSIDGWRNTSDQVYRSQTSGYRTLCLSALPKSQPSEARPSNAVSHNGSKRQRTESKIIPLVSRLPSVTSFLPESKKSALKKTVLLSSDPPNPVLVPLTVSRAPLRIDPSSPLSKVEVLNSHSNFDNTRHFQDVQNMSSSLSLQEESFSPEGSFGNQESSTLIQDIKTRLTTMPSDLSSLSPALYPATTQVKPPSENKGPQPQKNSLILTKETKPEQNTPLPPSQLDAPIPVKEKLLEIPHRKPPSEGPLPTLQLGCITVDSGKINLTL